MWYRIEAGIAGLLVLLIGTTIAAAGDPAPETPPAGNQADRLKQGAAFWVEAARLRDQGKLPEAIAAIEQVLVIEREHFGKTAPEEIAASLACLASLQDSIEDFAAARKSREEILSIRSRLHGPADWRTIDARLALQHTEWLAKASPQQRKELAESDRLLMQAVRLMKEGKPREAVPLAERSVSIRKQVLGDADLSYAFAAGRFAYISGKAGDYARAEQLFRQVSEILKKVLGENHPDYATNLNNLAVLYENRGDYERAEPLYRQALEIQRKVLGENHPDYAGSLNNLALLYEARGDYPRAEPLLRQALQIRKKVLGENDLDYAVSLNSLGEFYRAQGDYARAEPLLRQALEIKRRVLGENHPQFSASLNNLALLYEAQGDYARALPLLLQALEIDKKVLGENHPDYATSLNSLAGLCQDLGDYARAEMLFRQVLEIEKKTRGENHPYYAAALSNLACLYDDQGDYARAEPLYRQALEIQKKVLGENHPDYARSLNNLAKPYAAQGQYAQAEPLLRQASEIWKRVLGENHPDYAVSLNNLAALYECQGEDARAEPLFRRASAITRNHLDATAAVQSERQQLAMLQKLRWYLDSYLSLMVRTGRYTDPGYREMLAWKGIVLRRQRQLRAVGENPELAPVFAQLQRVAAQLARLAWATPDPKQEAGWHEQVARLSEEKERLEAELSSRSTAYRQAKRQVTLEELQAAIPKDVVLVDIIEFSRSEFVVLPQRGGIGAVLQRNDGGAKIEELVAGGEAAKDGRLQAGDLIVAVAGQDGKWTATPGRELKDVIGLIAGEANTKVNLRFRRGEEKQAREITLTRAPLPNQKKFDTRWNRELAAFVVAAGHQVEMVPLGAAKPIDEAIDTWRVTFGMSPQGAAAARLLRQRIWEPIEAKLQGAKIVLVSPDGTLAKLPLGALPGKERGKYLLEERTIAIVPVPQLIPEIVQEQGRKELRKNLLLLGNVDYDAQPGPAKPDAPAKPKKFGRELSQGMTHFPELSQTQGEIATIEKLYRQNFGNEGISTPLEQSQATKHAFLAAAGQHRYLHLATHGFFVQENLPPVPAPAGAGNRFGEMLRRPEAGGLHPGLLSGLALAGANRAGKPEADGADDGILTAEEIATQNLDGVQLVVLSACETGLGQAAGGEGLLGLQRAFQSAGARSVVASLWTVDDEKTRSLMERFYENHWQKNMGVLEALREAQTWLLHGRPDRNWVPADAPAKSTTLSPRFWAAFVLSGDWR